MIALDGKVALVTGGSRGIGKAIADALYDAGAHVVRIARSLRTERHDRRMDVACDITDESRLRSALGSVRDVAGVPDIVINNAGGFLLKPLGETTTDEFRRQLDVNLIAAFIIMHELLPRMRARGHGHFVTIGSIADHMALPGNAAYGASKWGLRGLHLVLAAEVKGTGIHATLISPGPTDTPLWDPVKPAARDDLPARASMLRPEDVADAVLYTVAHPVSDVHEMRLG